MAHKILIIEDEPTLQQAYRMILEIKGYDVETAENGEQGLSQLNKQVPDLILLDMLMPKMDGLQFMKSAKPSINYPKTKIILLSNFSNSSQIDEVLKLGITKQALKADVTPKQLVALVEEVLAS